MKPPPITMLVTVTETTGIDKVGNESRATFPAWKSRDGRVTKLTDLETNHLRNCIRMLYRVAFAIELKNASGMPEEAAWEHDPVLDRTPEDSLLAELPASSALLDEWHRRGLVENSWAAGVLS